MSGRILSPTSASEGPSPTTAPLPSSSKRVIPAAAAAAGVLLSVVCQSIRPQVQSWKEPTDWFMLTPLKYTLPWMCVFFLFLLQVNQIQIVFHVPDYSIVKSDIKGKCVKPDL